MSVPTTRTLLQLRQDALSRISENNNSPVGQLPSGTDSTPTEDTNAALTRYINEGARRLCRAAYPLFGTATFAGVNGTSFIPFNSFDAGTNGPGLWAVRQVLSGSTLIARATRAYTEINTTSTKQVWVPEGASGITLFPALTGSATITAKGFVVPPPLVNDGDTPAWLEPDLDYALVDYACGMLAKKAKSVDPALGALSDEWLAEFYRVELMQNARLKATDPNLWASHFQIAAPGGGK